MVPGIRHATSDQIAELYSAHVVMLVVLPSPVAKRGFERKDLDNKRKDKDCAPRLRWQPFPTLNHGHLTRYVQDKILRVSNLDQSPYSGLA